MKRSDWLLIVLGYVQLDLFFRVLPSLTSGSALWLMQQNNIHAWLLIALFSALFFLLFRNVAKIMMSLDKTEIAKMQTVMSTGKITVVLLMLYLALVFALSSQIN